MEKQFSIIDIFCGIGGMSKGFLDAGYQVNEAIDIDKEKVSIYNSVFCENIAKSQDIYMMEPKEVRDADIITIKIPLTSFNIAGTERKNSYDLYEEYMIRFVREKLPKAIVLECASDRLNIIRKITDYYENIGYHMYYKKLAGQNYSGLPFHNIRTYVVGIRRDIGNREFYFPEALYDANDISEKGYVFEKKVDTWYRKVSKIENYRFEEKKIYVRLRNQFYESNLIMNGAVYENYLCDSVGLRRCTHVEMARLKGLTLYDYNEYKNKKLMYRYIAQETNAFVSYYIANALKDYLDGNENIDYARKSFTEEVLVAKSNLRPLVVSNHDINMKDKIEDFFK